MKKVSSFRDLEVYKLCRQLAKEIFDLSKKFPKEETYSLTDQIRRASRSVGAQIAEAWGKRRYEKHFISKITDAGGEPFDRLRAGNDRQRQHWIDSARECAYMSEKEAESLLKRYGRVGSMLDSMIDKSSWFCS